MINDQILIRGIIQTSLLFLIAYSAGSLVFYKGVKVNYTRKINHFSLFFIPMFLDKIIPIELSLELIIIGSVLIPPSGYSFLSPSLSIAGMIYWIFFNSLLEEYVFRWFVTIKSIELLGNEARAIVFSAILFTLHHAIALHYFGFVWWQTVMACLGLLSAAAFWSWLYVRYGSVWVCWFSHAICDVAVFGIGYMIIFS